MKKKIKQHWWQQNSISLILISIVLVVVFYFPFSVINSVVFGYAGNSGGRIRPINGETAWFLTEVKRTDIIRDGKIDILDFNSLMVNWGQIGTDNLADVNKDGVVDILDFNLLMVNWGKTETI